MPDEETKSKLSFAALRQLVNNTARINKMLWKDRRGTIIMLLVLGLGISVLPFLRSGSLALLINELVDFVGGGALGAYFGWIVVLFIAATIIPSILILLQSYFLQLFRFFIEEKFNLAIIKKKGEIDIAVHEDPAYNDLFNTVDENGFWRAQIFGERQVYLVGEIVQVVVAAVILIIAKWWIFLIIFAATIPELLAETRYGKRVWGIWEGRSEVRRRFWDVRSHYNEVSSITELKLFQNLSHFYGIIRSLFRSFQKDQKKAERKRLFGQLFAYIFSQTAVALAVAWFIFMVIRGELLIGTLTFYLASLLHFRDSLSNLFGNLGRQYQDGLFLSDLFKLLDIKPVITQSKKHDVLSLNKTPIIEFENVSFAYPGTESMVLEDFSFSINAGEKIAFVGVNGAGKTTLVKLLCRFYDPTAGRILVDGHDLKHINIESWYHLMGVLFQDYSQYHFKVRDAIAIGRADVKPTLAKVKKAARASEADTFIEGWGKSFDQMLGRQFTDGVEPSIGQWQKLALARTFYRDPRILILDEPTSSIDAQAEARIFEKLESLPDDRTAIYISHRFSTVRQADRIAVIEEGAISELGTHNQLLKQKKTYAKLFKLQAEKYK